MTEIFKEKLSNKEIGDVYKDIQFIKINKKEKLKIRNNKESIRRISQKRSEASLWRWDYINHRTTEGCFISSNARFFSPEFNSKGTGFA